MSVRGTDFMNSWLMENIHVGFYPEDGKPDSRVPPLVAKCIEDAKAKGITRKEIEEDMGPVADCIAQALIDATNDEVDRLVAKDD